MASARGPEPAAERDGSVTPTAATEEACATNEVCDEASDGRPARLESPGVARTLARWATNLFASGLVVIAGLAGGREVLLWWRTPPPASVGEADLVGAVEPNWNYSDGFFDVRFGDAPLTLRRQTVAGDARVALEQLRRHTADLARQTLEAGVASELAGPARAETELERRLVDETPAAGEPGKWALHEWLAPLPRNVVVALPSGRVVAWGLAFPATDAPSQEPAWTLFAWTAEPGSDAQGANDPRWIVPRPAGATRGLSLRGASGDTLETFATRGDVGRLEVHYDEWSRGAGAVYESSWRTVGTMRTARFRLRDGRRATVQIDGLQGGSVRGVVAVWRDSAEEKVESPRR